MTLDAMPTVTVKPMYAHKTRIAVIIIGTPFVSMTMRFSIAPGLKLINYLRNVSIFTTCHASPALSAHTNDLS